MVRFFQQLHTLYQAVLLTFLSLGERLQGQKSSWRQPQVANHPSALGAKSSRSSSPRRFRKTTQNRRRLKQLLLWIGLALLLWLLVPSFHSLNWVSNANSSLRMKPPLSTRGAQIVDAAGRPVLLRGVNWFGLETEINAPHGLWSRDYKDMLAQMKRLGYNIIRLPYSVQSLRDKKVNGIDFKLGSNKDLEGKTPLEVMDLIIREAERQGILILLDSHRLNNQRIPELWYGDGFTEADWIDTWKMLATRYKNQANVIGADLKNEPHGRASWGTNDRATDWRLAAERAGNAILAINPNWLIVVEGVEKNVPGQKLEIHWMGGNLEGVKRFPVRLSVPNKLVYSPHEYGPGVFNQPWFSEPNFPKNLSERWEIGFNYIATQGIAPIFIGEFGGRQVDTTSKEGIWQRQLVDFIGDKNLGFSYWSWNPNSADTGGILLDDWLNVDVPKQKLLSKLLPAGSEIPSPAPTVLPTPSPRIQPSPNVTPTPSPRIQPSPNITPTPSPRIQPTPNVTPNSSSRIQSGSNVGSNSAPSVRSRPDVTYNSPPGSRANVRAEAIVESDWQTGFCVRMRVTNQGNTRIQNWQLKFRMNEAEINHSWNGIFTRWAGSNYIVMPPDWARVLQPNQTIDMGFCANKLGADYQPTQVSVN
jgi:endoglucanase